MASRAGVRGSKSLIRSARNRLTLGGTFFAPGQAELLATVGWAYYRNGRLDKARQALAAAAGAGRLLPDMAYYYARVLINMQEFDDAQKILQAATEQPGAFAHREEAEAALQALVKVAVLCRGPKPAGGRP